MGRKSRRKGEPSTCTSSPSVIASQCTPLKNGASYPPTTYLTSWAPWYSSPKLTAYSIGRLSPEVGRSTSAAFSSPVRISKSHVSLRHRDESTGENLTVK